jgi:hypothetical protein
MSTTTHTEPGIPLRCHLAIYRLIAIKLNNNLHKTNKNIPAPRIVVVQRVEWREAIATLALGRAALVRRHASIDRALSMLARNRFDPNCVFSMLFSLSFRFYSLSPSLSLSPSRSLATLLLTRSLFKSFGLLMSDLKAPTRCASMTGKNFAQNKKKIVQHSFCDSKHKDYYYLCCNCYWYWRFEKRQSAIQSCSS